MFCHKLLPSLVDQCFWMSLKDPRKEHLHLPKKVFAEIVGEKDLREIKGAWQVPVKVEIKKVTRL